jgi:hypothetical protein
MVQLQEAVGGQIDLFSPDFKLPQRLKYNIGVDQQTGIRLSQSCRLLIQ